MIFFELLINSNVLLPSAQKRVGLIIFPDNSEALGGAIAQIASSVGRSEAPEALKPEPSPIAA